MDELAWIKDVEVLEKPWVLLFNKDMGISQNYNGIVHDWLFKNGYKRHGGRRTIDKSIKVGMIMKSNDKYFSMLSNFTGVDYPETFKEYNVYFWEDIKDGNVDVWTPNLKQRVWEYCNPPEIYYTFETPTLKKK